MHIARPYALPLLLLLCALLSACAATPKYANPSIKLDKIELLPSQGFAQDFLISVSILNPNAVALPIKGAAYQISLNGHDVLSGASSELGEIPAYETANYQLSMSTDLFAGLALLKDLMAQEGETFEYALNARLDLNHWFVPSLNLSKKGQISLSQ